MDSLEASVAALAGFNIVLYTAQLFTILRNLKLPAVKYFLQLIGSMAILIITLAGIRIFFEYLFQ